MRILALTAIIVTSPMPASAQSITVHKDCPECPKMVKVIINRDSEKGSTKNSYQLLVGQFEVSWREYISAVEMSNCPLPTVSTPQGRAPYSASISTAKDDLPVTGLGRKGIECYLEWLNSQTNRRYRLPTSLEWIQFASGGSSEKFPWGNTIGFNNAIVHGAFDHSICKTVPISDQRAGFAYFSGCFKPNQYGLYDVIGNVGEITSDTAEVDPVQNDPNGRPRIVLSTVRGGNIFFWPGLSLDYVSQQILESYSDGLRVVSEIQETSNAH